MCVLSSLELFEGLLLLLKNKYHLLCHHSLTLIKEMCRNQREGNAVFIENSIEITCDASQWYTFRSNAVSVNICTNRPKFLSSLFYPISYILLYACLDFIHDKLIMQMHYFYKFENLARWWSNSRLQKKRRWKQNKRKFQQLSTGKVIWIPSSLNIFAI